jgi:2,3-bisphosphoglycerate-dependent phosphoglycerate mutase
VTRSEALTACAALLQRAAMPSTLCIVRHGQSSWNEKNLFTGWVDVDLTAQGEKEARNAGELMKKAGLWFDTSHTSVLSRAVRTANLALETLGQVWLPVNRSWRLNERHYGDLQGKDKVEMVQQFGKDQVQLWRRSYDVPPPPVKRDHEFHPANDQRYRALAPDALPTAECLKDVVAAEFVALVAENQRHKQKSVTYAAGLRTKVSPMLRV